MASLRSRLGNRIRRINHRYVKEEKAIYPRERRKVKKPVARFYNPKVRTGWHKSQTLAYRRNLVLKAHGRDLLSSARAMQALANVTQDKQTAIAARADAQYFYREYKRSKR